MACSMFKVCNEHKTAFLICEDQNIIITTIICPVDLKFSFRTRTVSVSLPVHLIFNA